ncbi:MAG: type IIL restriction-modification enzyme MmeI, partial [Akkermansiaceae bacterium]
MSNSDEPLATLTSASSSDHHRINTFISRWENSGAAERANYQMFLSELCEILEIPRPDPTSPDPEKNLYVFDRAITRTSPDGSAVTNYIDLYKAGHFVCETKQGSGGDSSGDLRSPSSKIGHGKRGSSAFDKALERAYHQGRDYITSLPASHGRPPFLIVCDVGYSIDLYSEFTCTGGRYERFPDPTHHRILLTDLREPKIRERLRLVFTDPLSLDPSKRAAEVTRDIATRLAKLAKSLEADGHDTQIIAGFLQRCLFTMFAEDIGLLPENGFRNLLEKVKSSPQGFTVLISGLWREMATGTQYSALLFQEIAYFNGGLFESTSALPLTAAQLDMLAHAAASDWSDVEPSIFGTLLTRALDSRERHKLGAEYTPRSYVERLIRPTIIEPLREEWEATRIAAASLHRDAEQLEALADQRQEEMNALGATKEAQAIGAERNKILADAKKKDAEALKLVTAFHRHLCAIK